MVKGMENSTENNAVTNQTETCFTPEKSSNEKTLNKENEAASTPKPGDETKNQREKSTETFYSSEKSLNEKTLNKENEAVSTPKPKDETNNQMENTMETFSTSEKSLNDKTSNKENEAASTPKPEDESKNQKEKTMVTFSTSEKSLNEKAFHKENEAESTRTPEDKMMNQKEKTTETFSTSEKPQNEKNQNNENKAAYLPEPEDEEQKKKKYTRTQLFTLVTLSVANFCAGSCVSIQAPFFPTEAEKKGATATQYGFIFGIYPLTLFMTSIVLGKMSHYIKPKVLVNLGLLTVGITCILFGTLDMVYDTDTFIALAFLIRIIEGVGSAALKTSCYIIIASQFSESIGTATGIVEMAYGVSYTTGPTLGGALYDLGGYGLPFWTMGTVAVVDAMAICFFLPGTERSEISEKGSMFKLWLHPRIMICSLSIFTTYNYVGFNHATLGIHLREFNLSGFLLGMMFAMVGTVSAFGSSVWGWLCDKKCCSLSLNLLCCILIIISLLLIGPAPIFNTEPRLWFVIVALALMGIAVGGKLLCSFIGAMEDTLNQGIPQNMATLGAISSVRIASQALGAFVGPSVGGYLLDNMGYRKTSMCLLLLETVLIISLIVSICNKKSRIRKTELIHSIEETSVSERYIANDEEMRKNRTRTRSALERTIFV